MGLNIDTVLYMKQIINKDLLNSTGDSIICKNLYGKRIKRTDTCICITESFSYTPETNTTV